MEALDEREPHVLGHALRECVERLEDVERGVARVDLARDVHLDSRARRRSLEAQPEVRVEGVGRRVEDLDGLAASGRALDADRRHLPERDLEAVLVRERRLDHLPLHLAVERDRDLRPRVVLADVDQGVLVGELPERDAQPPAVCVIGRLDDRLEGRRSEVVLDIAARLAEPVADLDLREAPELRDLARLHRVSLDGVAVTEDPDRGHLAGVEAVAHVHCTGEEPRVGDPVALRPAFDLEDAGRERPVAVTRARGQQLRDPFLHLFHAGAGERRAEEDGMQLAGA